LTPGICQILGATAGEQRGLEGQADQQKEQGTKPGPPDLRTAEDGGMGEWDDCYSDSDISIFMSYVIYIYMYIQWDYDCSICHIYINIAINNVIVKYIHILCICYESFPVPYVSCISKEFGDRLRLFVVRD